LVSNVQTFYSSVSLILTLDSAPSAGYWMAYELN
jgi:hypothetical protein